MALNKYLNLLSMDSHTFQQLRYRSLSLLTGILVVGIIPFFFDEILQGYYFTFASLLSIQVLFELGLNQVVVQQVGHEYAKLESTNNSLKENSGGNLIRLFKILDFFKKWYLVASILMFTGLMFLGNLLFYGKEEVSFAEWFYPWLLLSLVSSLNLYINMLSSVLEGLGKVDKVAERRFWGTFFGLILFSLLLFFKPSLFVMSAITACQIIAIISLVKKDRTLQQIKPVYNKQHVFLWTKEIFPFQWRIAVSWIAGYFSLYLFTPVTFGVYGPIEAGRIGFAFAIFNAVFGISSTWVSAQFPKFGHLISRGQKNNLQKVFKTAAIKSQITITFAIVSGIIIFLTLKSINSDLLSRLPTFFQFSLIASVTFINTYINSIASFMRAHKKEPLLVISIVQAILMVIVLLNAELGILFLLLGYNFINFFVVAIWATLKFRKFYYA